MAGYLDRYFETYWQSLVPALEAFVRANDLATLPAHRSLVVGTSPAYLAGQSVVGVYGAGPFEPNAVTLLFVPVPGGSANPSHPTFCSNTFERCSTPRTAPRSAAPGTSPGSRVDQGVARVRPPAGKCSTRYRVNSE
ncbi:MAG: hypothetical protein EXR94_11625 [Gemmatimonadetes bacterium]|nr:hypothetical protein [Gemmatimonadota bacterium]